MNDFDSRKRFSNRVDDYVRYRPGYPPALLEWVHGELGADVPAHVADIGAGTGISSKMFLEAGHEVFAVEPNAEMRAAAEQWLAGYPRFHTVNATAETTSLADASVQLVSAAQSFHWFNQDAVRREWGRILAPAGLALIYWNTPRFDTSPFLQEYEQLLHDHGNNYRDVAERHPDDAHMRNWFGSGFVDMIELPNSQRLDYPGLQGRLLSSSYAPRPGMPGYEQMLEALQALFQRHATDGHVDFPYRTRAFAGTLN